MDAKNNKQVITSLAVLGGLCLGTIVAVALFLGCSDTWCGLKGRSDYILKKSPVHNFLECAEAGFPVMESYPRTCFAGGRNFVEDLTMPKQLEAEFISLSSGQLVKSPLKFSGAVVGSWCFEASCPVRVLDGQLSVLGSGTAQVEEWMTADLVPFTASVTFKPGAAKNGFLEIGNGNPSGLPENERFVRLPVRFK